MKYILETNTLTVLPGVQSEALKPFQSFALNSWF